MTVKLYALDESVARKAAAACGVMTHGSSVNASAMEEATRALGGPPLPPGAAIVTALFPDVDATVREALGRLVDAWPSHDGSMGERGRFWEIHKNSANGIPIIYLYESTHKTPRYAAVFDGGCEFNGVEFVERGGGPRKRCLPRVEYTDPAACVAAIEAVIRRVSDAK